jgi:hypothetical protein
MRHFLGMGSVDQENKGATLLVCMEKKTVRQKLYISSSCLADLIHLIFPKCGMMGALPNQSTTSG